MIHKEIHPVHNRLIEYLSALKEHERVTAYWNTFRISTNPAKAVAHLNDSARAVQHALKRFLAEGAVRGRPKGSKKGGAR